MILLGVAGNTGIEANQCENPSRASFLKQGERERKEN
jgi:hypothetical protein